MAADDLNPAVLRELVDYDAMSGVFVWKRRPAAMFSDLRSCEAWNGRYAGKLAGGRSNEYISIRILERAFWAHRLAWLHFYGSWPAGEIDHINGDRTDNRIENLRDVPRDVNQQNIRARPANGSELPLGVHFLKRKRERCYSASIRVDGRSKHLGYFDTPEAAHDAYVEAKRIHHAGCTI